MAYLYEDIATTQKGKIIYPRKVHKFNSKDLLRLITKVEPPKTVEEIFYWLQAGLAMSWRLSQIGPAQLQQWLDALTVSLNAVILEDPQLAALAGDVDTTRIVGGTWWRPFPV